MGSNVANRDEQGRFVKGESGNPNGRPLGRKNQITALKQELELAVRDNIKPTRIRGILDKMCDLAEEGHVGAAKLVLDKVLSNATDTEDAAQNSGSFVFQVKNLTLKHDSPSEGRIIDVTPTKEVEANGDRSQQGESDANGPKRRRTARRKSPERTDS